MHPVRDISAMRYVPSGRDGEKQYNTFHSISKGRCILMTDEKIKLRGIDGVKLRWLHFNFYFYFMAACMPMPLILILVSDALQGTLTPQSLMELIKFAPACVIALVPFLIVSLINRVIGKVVCVINDEGIHHPDGFIRWNDVEKVEYEARMLSKYGTKGLHDPNHFCHAKVTCRGEDVLIMHVPATILLHIRRHAPEIPAKMSKRSKLLICFWALFPAVMGAVLPLIVMAGR